MISRTWSKCGNAGPRIVVNLPSLFERRVGVGALEA